MASMLLTGMVTLQIGDQTLRFKATDINFLDDGQLSVRPVEGWAWPTNSRKAHYFVDGRSLCGRWGYFGTQLHVERGVSEQNCVACKNKRVKQEKQTRRVHKQL